MRRACHFLRTQAPKDLSGRPGWSVAVLDVADSFPFFGTCDAACGEYSQWSKDEPEPNTKMTLRCDLYSLVVNPSIFDPQTGSPNWISELDLRPMELGSFETQQHHRTGSTTSRLFHFHSQYTAFEAIFRLPYTAVLRLFLAPPTWRFYCGMRSCVWLQHDGGKVQCPSFHSRLEISSDKKSS